MNRWISISQFKSGWAHRNSEVEKGARVTKVLILGGDGYCGWPTSLHLSDIGHEVVIVDNCVRQTIDHELSAASLTSISEIKDRIGAWREVSGQIIGFEFGDLLDWEFVSEVVQRHQPEAIVHFAEQRAAPYSMIALSDDQP